MYEKKNTKLKKAMVWIQSHKRQIKIKFHDFFDYPEYWGLPKSISNCLMPDEVDYIQEQTYDFGLKLRNGNH